MMLASVEEIVAGALFFTRFICTAGPVSEVGSGVGFGGGLSPPEPKGFPEVCPADVGLRW